MIGDAFQDPLQEPAQLPFGKIMEPCPVVARFLYCYDGRVGFFKEFLDLQVYNIIYIFQEFKR